MTLRSVHAHRAHERAVSETLRQIFVRVINASSYAYHPTILGADYHGASSTRQVSPRS